MTMLLSLRGGALAAALLSLPLAALAQTAAAPTTTAKPAAPSASGAAAAAPADAGAQARVEARIKQLHAELKITSAEEGQWKEFADTMRANAQEMDALAAQRGEQLSSLNAVDDLKSYEQMAEAHVQHLQKLIPAFETLYNALSPEQKQTADQVFRPGAARPSPASAKQ